MFYRGEFLLIPPFSFTQVLSNFFVNSFSYSLFLQIGWTCPPPPVKVQVAEILSFWFSVFLRDMSTYFSA